MILIDRRNRVLKVAEVYRNSVNSSQLSVGDVFKEAIRKNASGIIVVHNRCSPAPTRPPARTMCGGNQGDRPASKFSEAPIPYHSY